MAEMVGREVYRPPEICPMRLAGTGRIFLALSGEAQEGATYKVIFEPNTLMKMNFLHSKCRGLQSIIDRPKRSPRCIADSRSAMACDATCFSFMR